MLSSITCEPLEPPRIRIVGIDYLSIEQFDELTVHKKLLSKNILIYETLRLSGISSGKYLFYGFPLKIHMSEGSPARVLLSDNMDSIELQNQNRK